MSQISTKECANLTGLTARSIQNAIKSGKLSAIRDSKGFYKVDTSELLRVYPNAKLEEINEVKEENNTKELEFKVNDLEKELTYLKSKYELLERNLKGYEEREIKLIDTFQNTTRLLENKKKKRFIFF